MEPAYLRVLREHTQMSRQTLAHLLQTDDSQIERIEHGQINTRGTLLVQWMDRVDGSVADLQQLLHMPQLSAAVGRAHARTWLAQRARAETESRTPQQVRVLKILEALRDDPYRMGLLTGYGQCLRDLRDEPQGEASTNDRSE